MSILLKNWARGKVVEKHISTSWSHHQNTRHEKIFTSNKKRKLLKLYNSISLKKTVKKGDRIKAVLLVNNGWSLLPDYTCTVY